MWCRFAGTLEVFFCPFSSRSHIGASPVPSTEVLAGVTWLGCLSLNAVVWRFCTVTLIILILAACWAVYVIGGLFCSRDDVCLLGSDTSWADVARWSCDDRRHAGNSRFHHWLSFMISFVLFQLTGSCAIVRLLSNSCKLILMLRGVFRGGHSASAPPSLESEKKLMKREKLITRLRGREFARLSVKICLI